MPKHNSLQTSPRLFGGEQSAGRNFTDALPKAAVECCTSAPIWIVDSVIAVTLR